MIKKKKEWYTDTLDRWLIAGHRPCQAFNNSGGQETCYRFRDNQS